MRYTMALAITLLLALLPAVAPADEEGGSGQPMHIYRCAYGWIDARSCGDCRPPVHEAIFVTRAESASIANVAFWEYWHEMVRTPGAREYRGRIVDGPHCEKK